MPFNVVSMLFGLVHRNNLIYNACWEDPACDRLALDFRPEHRVLVITSAGCNALDYLLAGAGEVHAVDLNFRQNALLELKLAGLRNLLFDDLFALFGTGSSPEARELYRFHLRGDLSLVARQFWDRHLRFFEGRGWRRSFYYHGTNGVFSWLLKKFADWRGLAGPLARFVEAPTLEAQQAIYRDEIVERFWTPGIKWFLSRNAPFLLLGVPGPQRDEILAQFPGGTAEFSRWCLEGAFARVPIRDNYFWRVSLTGSYSRDCCPEYLKPDNVERLKGGLLDRLHWATGSITDYLRRSALEFDRFVLLDHMDWMSWQHPDALAAEWSAILAHARPGARVLFRSAGLRVGYLDNLKVEYQGRSVALGELLRYRTEQAAELHARDRTQIYGSCYLADLP